MAKWNYLGRETTNYKTGDKVVEDVFEDDKGDLVISSYNIPESGKNYSHSSMCEDGKYVGGHGPDGRTWKDREDRDK